MAKFQLDLGQLQIVPEGALSRGAYEYRVVAILPEIDLDLANTLRIVLPHRRNSVGIAWDEVPGAQEYRVIRRGPDGREGSILVRPPAFFFDNGEIEFDEWQDEN